MLCKNMTKSRKSTKRYKEIHKTQNEMIPTAVDYVVLQCVLNINSFAFWKYVHFFTLLFNPNEMYRKL